MKTHEVARALENLAKMLRSGPNRELSEFQDEIIWGRQSHLQPEEIKIGLSQLVALARVDKQQWISLIEEYGFPVDIRPRDASRDVLDKLLRYLEQDPDARNRLARSAAASSSKASPELMKALGALLKD
jgi:hypothetical protein